MHSLNEYSCLSIQHNTSIVIAIADWTQRGSKVNINSAKSHANISVYGTWEYNAEVGKGAFTIPIGFRVSDSYDLTL